MFGELMKLLAPDRLLGVAFSAGTNGMSAREIGFQRSAGMMLPGNGCRVQLLNVALQAVVAGS